MRPLAHVRPLTAVPRTFAFLDLCGFTSLMEHDGHEAAISLLRQLRDEVRSIASSHAVRVDKWLGDGVMLVGTEAAPVVVATTALIEVSTSEFRLPLRAGVASGDVVVFDGADYVGRAVNLAARLSDLASPGFLLMADTPSAASMSGEPRLLQVPGFDAPVSVVEWCADRLGARIVC